MDDALQWTPDGHCTEAYEDWYWTRSDVVTFLDLSMQWSVEGYGRMRREAAELSQSRGCDEQATFYELVNELTPTDYAELLCSLVVQRVVTAFDIYHEAAMAELGRLRGFRLVPARKHFDSPSWKELIGLYNEILEVDIDQADTRSIRTLRHRLVHQAGELRRAEDQFAYGEGRTTEYRPQQARLTPSLVKSHMRTLDAQVQRIDQIIWPLAYQDDPMAPKRDALNLFLQRLDEQLLENDAKRQSGMLEA